MNGHTGAYVGHFSFDATLEVHHHSRLLYYPRKYLIKHARGGGARVGPCDKCHTGRKFIMS